MKSVLLNCFFIYTFINALFIGKYIIEYEQEGSARAKYGSKLLENLSRDLTLRHGRGFSRSNLNYMRLFYLRFPICEKLSHKLEKLVLCRINPMSILNWGGLTDVRMFFFGSTE